MRTLVSAKGAISQFAQDGNRIAWFTAARAKSGYRCVLATQDLRTSKRWHVRDPACDYSTVGGLALGGRRVLGYSVAGGTVTHITPWSWEPGKRPRPLHDDYLWEYDGGTDISAVAADGANLFYGTVRYSEGPSSCDGNCSPVLRGGTLERVGTRSSAQFVAVPPGTVALANGLVAVLPMESESCACNVDPSWSPNGNSIAFQSRRSGPDKEISVVNADGGRPIEVTADFLDDRSPDWSPDGERIVFAAAIGASNSRPELRTIGPGGKDEHTLFSDCALSCDAPDWSPDGSRIAFVRYLNEGTEIFVLQADGSHPVRIGDGYDPTWSPDGSRIAFYRASKNGYETVVVQADGSQPVRVGSGATPTWSPDGTAIAFQRYDAEVSHVWLVNSDGSNPRPLVAGWAPVWSSAGTLAFLARAHDTDDSELHTIKPDGTDLRQITNNDSDDYSPVWSPDGSRLVFVSTPGKKPHDEIYVVNADGTGERRITTTRPQITHFPVEVYKVGTARLVSRFSPHGYAIDVAVSGRFGATITREAHGRTSVEVFRTSSGRRLGSVRVRKGANSVSMARRTIVFASGHRIWALDAVRRKPAVISVAKSNPIDLSIEGRRVAWAERVDEKRSRIRALWMPASR